MKKLFYHISLVALLVMLVSCTRYDVELSEVQFTHDDVNNDVITFYVHNPMDIDLTCKLDINPQGQESIVSEFDIDSLASEYKQVIAQFPDGETRIIMDTMCKPRVSS